MIFQSFFSQKEKLRKLFCNNHHLNELLLLVKNNLHLSTLWKKNWTKKNLMEIWSFERTNERMFAQPLPSKSELQLTSSSANRWEKEGMKKDKTSSVQRLVIINCVYYYILQHWINFHYFYRKFALGFFFDEIKENETKSIHRNTVI